MKSRSRRRQGFTLMELLLVMAILVILASLAGFFLLQTQQTAYSQAAQTQIGLFEDLLDAYRLHVGSYPSTSQGLGALKDPPADLSNPKKWKGPYIEKDIPVDPWDNEYRYEAKNKKEYRLWSMGPDGIDGTEDDVEL